MSSRMLAGAAAALVLSVAPSAHAADGAPMRLPPAAGGVSAASTLPATWLVGARQGAAAQRLARRFGARALRVDGTYRVATTKARAFAAALRRSGVLTYAEPNVGLRHSSAIDVAPTSGPRSVIVDAGLAPPAPVGTAAIAVVDDLVDRTHPDLATNVAQINPGPVLGPHGTMVASTAAGLFNGAGVFGVFPGAPILSYGMPVSPTCADGANGVLAAARAKARVINLSFGTPDDCATLFYAIQRAYAAGSLVVASAGNEFAEGNPVIFPAAYPHVLSVAAIDPTFNATDFSNQNTAIDVAAPGVGIPVAIPPQFDTDGTVDGATIAAGTSFSSPMVAGVAAWLATVRPQLSNGQLADVIRRSALDISTPGYDSSTGFGLVRMAPALALATPARDVLEPNDGITFVDGTVFGRPDPFLWRGTGRRTINSTVDQVEDPVDVYRFRLPRGARTRIRTTPSLGDPNLFVFSGNAKSINQTGRIVAHSERGPLKTDTVTLTNRGTRTKTYYVLVTVAGAPGGAHSAAYRLRLERIKRR